MCKTIGSNIIVNPANIVVTFIAVVIGVLKSKTMLLIRFIYCNHLTMFTHFLWFNVLTSFKYSLSQ